MRIFGPYGKLPRGQVSRVDLVQLRSRGASAAMPEPLLDRQDRRVRYLRVSLTDRCNYRCTYCMPPDGVAVDPRHAVLCLEEVGRVCAVFARWGVRRVRLTGGEPTLRRGLAGLVRALAAVPVEDGSERLQVVMTTNGDRLAELADELCAAGLGGLTVSLDTLDAQRFAAITRRGVLDRVRDGIDAACRAGFPSLKLNTVAIRGFNDDELGAIARYAWERDMVPRFIELMPMASGALFVPGELMVAADVRAAVEQAIGSPLEPDDGVGVRGLGPARYWRVARGLWCGRRMGTIAPMSENFCASCNRLRLSATGRLHACLARDETGDLRAALRSGDGGALENVVRAVLGTKPDGHGFNRDGSGGPKKAMISIGG
jgi:GTP 3',8-cyclase